MYLKIVRDNYVLLLNVCHKYTYLAYDLGNFAVIITISQMSYFSLSSISFLTKANVNQYLNTLYHVMTMPFVVRLIPVC